MINRSYLVHFCLFFLVAAWPQVAVGPPDPDLDLGEVLLVYDERRVRPAQRPRVRRADLIGPATSIYFSQNPRTSEIRWSRVGEPIL